MWRSRPRLRLPATRIRPAPRQLTHNQAVETTFALGQRQSPHLLHRRSRRRHRPLPRPAASSLLGRSSLTPETPVEQWRQRFHRRRSTTTPSPAERRPSPHARLGTEVPMYVRQHKPSAPLRKFDGWHGTYEISQPACTPCALPSFTPRCTKPVRSLSRRKSRQTRPSARPITSFNKLFTERDCLKASPTAGRPTTAPPSKAC